MQTETFAEPNPTHKFSLLEVVIARLQGSNLLKQVSRSQVLKYIKLQLYLKSQIEGLIEFTVRSAIYLL